MKGPGDHKCLRARPYLSPPLQNVLPVQSTKLPCVCVNYGLFAEKQLMVWWRLTVIDRQGIPLGDVDRQSCWRNSTEWTHHHRHQRELFRSPALHHQHRQQLFKVPARHHRHHSHHLTKQMSESSPQLSSLQTEWHLE